MWEHRPRHVRTSVPQGARETTMERSQKNDTLAAVISTLVLALLSGVVLASWVERAGQDRLAALAAGSTLALCLWSCRRLLRLDPLSPAMIYLYVFAVFHLGLVVPWALGLYRAPLPYWMQVNRLSPALTQIILAMAGYQVGLSLAVWRWRELRSGGGLEPVRYCNVVLYHFGLAIVMAGLLAFVWGVRSLGAERLLQLNYFETYALTNRHDPRFFISSLTLVPIGLYLAAAAAPRRRIPLVVCLVSAWSAGILFLGFRGYALVPAVAVLAVLSKRGVRLPRAAWLLGLAGLLIVIPLVRGLRASRLAERSVSEALEAVEPWAAFGEMGGSLRPLVHTLDFMEAEPWRWGETYWQALQAALPNLSLNWQGGSYRPLDELPPNHWVSRQAAPRLYREFGGMGFSAVAEPYMNFGTPGVVAYFLLLGAALGWADQSDAGRPTRLAMWAVVLGPLLWTTRNDFHALFRPALLGLASVWLGRILSDSVGRVGGGHRPRRTASARRAATPGNLGSGHRPGAHPAAST